MRYTIILVSVILFSCAKKEEKKSLSTISYESKTFRLESAGGCAEADTVACASYEINYPVFTGLNAAAGDSLARKISEAVDTGNPEMDTVSFEAAGKNFIASFEETKNEMPGETMGWYYKSTLTVNVNTDTLVSIEANNEYFTGGAHGGYGSYFINIHPATGTTFRLSDILKAGYEEALQNEGEVIFRRSQQLADTASLADQGFEFPDDRFVLNDNYGFTKEGILFVFNVYEIAPYALGAQEVLIPYESVKRWIK